MDSQSSESEKYELLVELADNVFVARIPIENLLEQKLNARTMPRDMFKQLTANIGARGAMVESLPFCAETKDGVEIVSGHHRIRGARSAGLPEVFILLDRSGLTKSQIISKQLSHNSISGVDDKQILKELFEQIEEAESKIAAFIDPKELNIPSPASMDIQDLEVDLTFKHVSFVFLDNQLEKFNEVAELIAKDTALVGAADLQHFDKFKAAVQKVRDIEDIRAVGMILSKMCDIVLEHYKPIEEALEKEKSESTSGTKE